MSHPIWPKIINNTVPLKCAKKNYFCERFPSTSMLIKNCLNFFKHIEFILRLINFEVSTFMLLSKAFCKADIFLNFKCQSVNFWWKYFVSLDFCSLVRDITYEKQDMILQYFTKNELTRLAEIKWISLLEKEVLYEPS